MVFGCRSLPAAGGAGDVSDGGGQLQRAHRAQVARVPARAAPRPPHARRAVAPRRTAPRRTVPHRTAPHRTAGPGCVAPLIETITTRKCFASFEIRTDLHWPLVNVMRRRLTVESNANFIKFPRLQSLVEYYKFCDLTT